MNSGPGGVTEMPLVPAPRPPPWYRFLPITQRSLCPARRLGPQPPDPALASAQGRSLSRSSHSFHILHLSCCCFSIAQFSSVAQSCPTLCDPMNRSTPGLPVHHQLPEFTQTHVHRVSDAISSSVVPFSSCPQSLPASESFPMSQLFS